MLLSKLLLCLPFAAALGINFADYNNDIAHRSFDDIGEVVSPESLNVTVTDFNDEGLEPADSGTTYFSVYPYIGKTCTGKLTGHQEDCYDGCDRCYKSEPFQSVGIGKYGDCVQGDVMVQYCGSDGKNCGKFMFLERGKCYTPSNKHASLRHKCGGKSYENIPKGCFHSNPT